jgi:hypothetical protein
MEIQEAVAVLINELNNDPSYRESWKANIAMAFKDVASAKSTGNVNDFETDHLIANAGAEYFLKLLCYTHNEDDLPGGLSLARLVSESIDSAS